MSALGDRLRPSSDPSDLQRWNAGRVILGVCLIFSCLAVARSDGRPLFLEGDKRSSGDGAVLASSRMVHEVDLRNGLFFAGVRFGVGSPRDFVSREDFQRSRVCFHLFPLRLPLRQRQFPLRLSRAPGSG